jgi:hypothetical protein
MSEGTVKTMVRMFKCGRTNVHDEERSGRPSVVMFLFKVLTKKLVKDGASKLQNFRMNLHKFHALFSTVISQLN